MDIKRNHGTSIDVLNLLNLCCGQIGLIIIPSVDTEIKHQKHLTPQVDHWYELGWNYPPVIKRGNGKSTNYRRFSDSNLDL